MVNSLWSVAVINGQGSGVRGRVVSGLGQGSVGHVARGRVTGAAKGQRPGAVGQWPAAIDKPTLPGGVVVGRWSLVSGRVPVSTYLIYMHMGKSQYRGRLGQITIYKANAIQCNAMQDGSATHSTRCTKHQKRDSENPEAAP